MATEARFQATNMSPRHIIPAFLPVGFLSRVKPAAVRPLVCGVLSIGLHPSPSVSLSPEETEKGQEKAAAR